MKVQIGEVSSPKEFALDETPYHYPVDKNIIYEQLENREPVFMKKDKDLGAIYAYNVAASFDIETSSFRQHTTGETKEEFKHGGRKYAVMYVWQFSINGRVIIGRTWHEFKEFMLELSQKFELSPWKQLIIYVHNLGYEFQFMRKYFTWSKVFSSAKREPIYAKNTLGLEFRDSYILTSKSLDLSARDLTKYKVKKLVGNLDYKKIRSSATPLSDEELAYCVHDDLVVDAIIQEKIESERKGIAGIPLTNTGYVRRFIRNKCFSSGRRHGSYADFIQRLTLTPEEYLRLKEAFQGGFTHANRIWVNKTIKGIIDSFDFTSSYPAVILSEKFPMQHCYYKVETQDDFYRMINDSNVCSIFKVYFKGLREKPEVYDDPISTSKCSYLSKDAVVNNGRLVRASDIITRVTNVDFKVYQQFYDWDSFRVAEIDTYQAAYLPKPIIESVLDLYKAKTTLKGVEGQEAEYMVKKGMLNSTYGCMVTDIVKELIAYSNDLGWDEPDEELDVAEKISKYNTSYNRFLYYPWGVFVTSYARRNLFSGILACGEDYLYSDTDSIKCINASAHMNYFRSYNTMITKKVARVLQYYGIDQSEAAPKTIKGVSKQIGVWDWETEGTPYTEFKTCGAKRYMYTQNEEIHTTIAGLPKKAGAKYISSQDNPYDFFSDGMVVPSDKTTKLISTYLDDPYTVHNIDYMGVEFTAHEESGIHMEGARFEMSETSEFVDYLKGIQKSYIGKKEGVIYGGFKEQVLQA